VYAPAIKPHGATISALFFCGAYRFVTRRIAHLGNRTERTDLDSSKPALAERQAADESLTDTGVGIPPHLLESIFERFWQVGVNGRRGLGLGLYISRSIVHAHGGRIWAESADRAGSTFFVTLPTTPESALAQNR